MTTSIFTLLTAVSIFVTLVLALFFFINKRGYIHENRILAALLVVFSLQIFFSFATSAFAWRIFIEWHKPLFIVRMTSFLVGPLLWLYVNSFLKRKDSLAGGTAVHFIPFFLAVASLLVFYRGVGKFVIWLSMTDLYFTLLILAHSFIYIVLSLMSMKSTTLSLKGLYKSIFITNDNRWLQVVLIGFILMWVINLNSFSIYMIMKKPGWCSYTYSIYALAAFLFINTLMFFLLFKPEVYYVIAKYKNTKLSLPDKMEYLEKLQVHMETRKPYLNPDITLETLANEISVHPRILSQIINETYKKNFKSYILEYRIRESMQILSDSKHKHLTILEVLYQVGFNSKSAFNNQFKLFTNLTPIEYRSRAIG